MNSLVYQMLASRKRRIAARIRHDHRPSEVPLLAASNIHYELSARDRGIACGGIGAVHLLARQSGLIEKLDRRLHLLKIHLPYHESDHVLTIAYNILAGGDCLEDLELLRQDEVFLDALGAKRLPDPTTAGDFCRRFDEAAVWTLHGRDQPDPPERLGAPAAGVLSAGHPRCRRHAGPHHRGVQAGDGHLL